MELTNLDIVKVFVGIEIIRDRPNRDITLSQRGYTSKLLDKFTKELSVKSNSYCQGIRLQPNQEKTTPEDIQLFQQQIGSLMYLMTATRPDLTFSIGQLVRYMRNPHGIHFKTL